jgi:hypothetical protein
MNMFEEVNLFVPYISHIPYIKPKEVINEHFTNEEYETIQNTIRLLREKQSKLNNQIQEQMNHISNMSNKQEKYNTFYHLFENTEERNQSYHKMMLFLITLIILLIISIVYYFIYFN